MIWLIAAGAFVVGLAIGGGWSLRNIRKHRHDWSRWSRLEVNTKYRDGTSISITKQRRVCKTCGYETIDTL